MKVDSVITLENNVNCLLLEKEEHEGKNYFLSVVLNENDEPTEEYAIFEEIIENDKIFVEKVVDKDLVDSLVGIFTVKLDKFIDELPEEE